MTKIIAFEGIDGTGKSVQMERLCEALKARGLSVLEISFPMYDTFFGDLVGRYLSAKDGIGANTVDGKSMALWFALDRFEAFRENGLITEATVLYPEGTSWAGSTRFVFEYTDMEMSHGRYATMINSFLMGESNNYYKFFWY